MKKWIRTLLVAFVSLGFTAGFAGGQPTKDVLENRAQRINALIIQQGSMQQALRLVSDQTGVPVRRLQSMRIREPDVGAAGLLIAFVLAENTVKPPEHFLRRHAMGIRWSEIAGDNGVSISTINLRLDRLERSLSPLPPTGHPNPTPPPLVPPRPMY